MNDPLKTVCDLKWNYSIFSIDRGEFRSCCRTPSNKVTEEELNELGINSFLNSPKQRLERLELVQGKQTQSCSSCWKLEKHGIKSPRHNPPQMWNHLVNSKIIPISTYSPDQLKLELSKIDNINHGALYSYNPYILEIILGNICDMKCMYCTHHYSSQWASEKIKYSEITQEQYEKEFPKAPPSFEKKFWEWFIEVGRHSVTRISIIGGEPLIMPEFYVFVDKFINCLAEIKDQKTEKITLSIVTNLNTPSKYFQKFIEYLPKMSKFFELEIYASMESIGKKAEYIRHGVDWERFNNNVNILLSNNNVNFGFMPTVNILSISSLKDFLEYVKNLYDVYKKPIILKQNIVSYPSCQNPMLLTEDFIPYIKDAMVYIIKNIKHMPNVKDKKGTWFAYFNFLKTIIEGIKTTENKNFDRKKFAEWFDLYDERRGLSLLDVFPEYTDFYLMCKEIKYE